MKNFDDVLRFLKDAVETGSLIARDHDARSIDNVHVGYRIDDLPPSIASGVGQSTQALIFVVRVSFTPGKTPVSRTRKFTIFDKEAGQEIWPGAEMSIDGHSCFFELHVGNATNAGWGVFATWRNSNLQRVLGQIESILGNMSVRAVAQHSRLPISEVTTFTW